MSKKDNIPLGVRQEFDDIDYWHKLPKNKFVELPNGEKISVYDYMKKFMHESYANNFSRSEPESNILQTEEQKKWARRNNNNTNRDALNVIKKSGKMATLFHVEAGHKPEDEEEWEKIFKLEGYEPTFEFIVKQFLTKFNIEFNMENCRELLKFYFTVKRFLTAMRRDKNNNTKKCMSCGKRKDLSEFNKHGSSRDGLRRICKSCVSEEQ